MKSKDFHTKKRRKLLLLWWCCCGSWKSATWNEINDLKNIYYLHYNVAWSKNCFYHTHTQIKNKKIFEVFA